MSSETEIRPFRVDVPDEAIADLRRRIAATRWPSKELVTDRAQGVQLATIQELTRYWATDYDWRNCEAKLNALSQFTTEIDGVGIHFIHVKSRARERHAFGHHAQLARPVIELLGVVGPLTDPAAHGGRAEDAFDLVLPSLPGYGFSGGGGRGRLELRPRREGLGGADAPPRLHPLRRPGRRPRRLGHRRDGPPGAPRGCAGIHMNLLVTALAGGAMQAETEQERAALEQTKTFRASGFGYFLEQATRPQTIGYALLDSPVALAAWMLDHDTDAYEKISRAFVDGQVVRGSHPGPHPGQHHGVLADGYRGFSGPVVLGERTSPSPGAAGQPPAQVRLPVGFTTFPGEIFRAPRSWVEASYPTLTYFHKAGQGGHFAA